MATMIITAIILAWVAVVVIKKVMTHRSGERTCECGCLNCAAVKTCHPPK